MALTAQEYIKQKIADGCKEFMGMTEYDLIRHQAFSDSAAIADALLKEIESEPEPETRDKAYFAGGFKTACEEIAKRIRGLK